MPAMLFVTTAPIDKAQADTIAALLLLIGFMLAVGLWFRRRERRRVEPAAAHTRSATVHHLLPGPDDEPLRPQEVFVAGITKRGHCGLDRQDVIARCRPGETIYLVRQPSNADDPNAIALFRADGTDIGYLPREVAAEYAPRLDRGSPIIAEYGYTEQIEGRGGRPILAPRLIVTLHRLRRGATKPGPMTHFDPRR